MSANTSSRPVRLRPQPQRIQHEQEDDHLRRQELLHLLYAMRLSVASDGEESDESDESGSEEDEENDEVDELSLLTDKEERKKWNEAWEDEEKAGWNREHSPLLVNSFMDSHPSRHSALASCTTPLNFFHAMIPLTFFHYITDNINVTYHHQH
jgi:hypothetical protein